MISRHVTSRVSSSPCCYCWQGRPQLTHPPQFGMSGTVTHWFTIDTPLIWNVRVCDTVLMIGLLCVENLLKVSMGVSKLAIPVCH